MNHGAASGKSADRLAEVLELRSYTRIGGTFEFSVYNKEAKRSEWLRVNEERHGYMIESYDPETNTIVIHYKDQIGSLYLQSSRIAEYVAPAPANAPESPTPPNPLEQLLATTNDGDQQSNPSAGIPERPSPPSSGPPSRTHSNDETGAFLSRTSSPGPVPPSSPPPTNENPGGDGNEPDGSYWDNADSPPPIPSTPPPGYSPEE